MNSIRAIRELNQKELEAGISPDASWHVDYRDTAYVYIGGLPFELSEGDVITIFSQFGEPTYINLIRDKETGKSRGFAFLKYEDQRSTDLAVDNLGGAVVMGRTLKVDHTRYKKKDDEPDDGMDLTESAKIEVPSPDEDNKESARPMLREERELAILIRDHDDDDPMKSFLIEEKREEIAKAVLLLNDGQRSRTGRKSKERHRRSHRPRDDEKSREYGQNSSRRHGERGDRRSRSPERSHRRRDSYDLGDRRRSRRSS